jgi:hypothetical protein
MWNGPAVTFARTRRACLISRLAHPESMGVSGALCRMTRLARTSVPFSAV